MGKGAVLATASENKKIAFGRATRRHELVRLLEFTAQPNLGWAGGLSPTQHRLGTAAKAGPGVPSSAQAVLEALGQPSPGLQARAGLSLGSVGRGRQLSLGLAWGGVGSSA